MRALFIELLDQGLYAAILAAMVYAVILSIVYCIHQHATRGQKPFPSHTASVLFLLVCYLTALLSITVLRRPTTEFSQLNLHLFTAWQTAWNSFSRYAWVPMLLDMALFAPLGLLLPFLAKAFRKWYVTLGTGLGVSLIIEVLQYAARRGTADVDNLFANTLGAMLGFCLVMLVSPTCRGDGRRRAAYAAFPLAFAAVLAGVFAGYYLREYGCLPDASAFTINTYGIEWTADCQLSSLEQSVPIYHREPLTKTTCDEFSSAFAEKLGLTFPNVDDYGDLTIYANRSTGDFLIVYYLDGSYEYTVGGNHSPGTEFAETDEETLRDMLQVYGVAVPDTAEFSYAGYRHTFTVNMELDGDTLLDGTLTCYCLEDEAQVLSLHTIENSLVFYEYAGEAEIISPAEAYARLCAGRFSSIGSFEYTVNRYGVHSVTVTSCTLEYRVDTKGFYQPVYIFTMETPDGRGFDSAVVPALIT